MKLMKLLGHPDLNNDTVIECLKYDNVLTAKVLRACNSSFYGFQQTISSIDEAVLFLGYSQILRIVTTLSVGGPMAAPMPAYEFQANDLWRHSLAAAFVSESLAKEGVMPGVDPAAAFTAGLLHDIGKIAFSQVLNGTQLARLRYQIAEHGLSRVEAEREIIGTDHADVGGCLLQRWELPQKIVKAVAMHHKPDYSSENCLSAVTCLSDTIVNLAGPAPGWAPYALKVDNRLVGNLKLTPEKLDALLIEARDSFTQAEEFIEMV